MLLFLTTNMAAVTSLANQQYSIALSNHASTVTLSPFLFRFICLINRVFSLSRHGKINLNLFNERSQENEMLSMTNTLTTSPSLSSV